MPEPFVGGNDVMALGRNPSSELMAADTAEQHHEIDALPFGLRGRDGVAVSDHDASLVSSSRISETFICGNAR